VGCPDAVRAGILTLPGIYEVQYDAQANMFVVKYETGRISLEAIFARVHQAGRRMGREYFPERLT
jgi:copper chaperone CopZ